MYYLNLVLQGLNIIDNLIQNEGFASNLHQKTNIFLWKLVPCISCNKQLIWWLIELTLSQPGTRACSTLILSLILSLLTWEKCHNKMSKKEAQTTTQATEINNKDDGKNLQAMVHSTLSARLWLSVACPLLALTWMYPLGSSSSSTSLLLLSLFPPLLLVLSFEFESCLFNHTRSTNCVPHVHETNLHQKL